MSNKQISVFDLILDTENPRIPKATSQREALQRILDDQQGKLLVLAKDIVENGLNPMDRWLVLPPDSDGKHVVLEGNRRLAVIKILINPSVLGDLQISSSRRKRFEALSAEFKPAQVGNIDCFVVTDRAEADTWIQQRHTGANEGKGIVDWSGLATARFRGDSPALQALDLVIENGNLSASQLETIENSSLSH